MKFQYFLIQLLFIACFLMGCQHYCEPEEFRIPAGFNGKVTIIFNRENGISPRRESGVRIYEIPLDGVLVTKFQNEYGVISQTYKFVYPDGHREVIKQLDVRDFNEAYTLVRNQKEPSRDQVAVFHAGSVGSCGSSDSPNQLMFAMFYVCTYSELHNYSSPEFYEQHEKLIWTKVNKLEMKKRGQATF